MIGVGKVRQGDLAIRRQGDTKMKYQNTKHKIQINNKEENYKFKTNQSISLFVISIFGFGIYLSFGICCLGFDGAMRIFQLTKSFQKDEKYSLFTLSHCLPLTLSQIGVGKLEC